MNSTKNYSITKNGKTLDKKRYTICEETKTFSSDENGLTLDFSGLGGWTFTTGSNCTFKTGYSCTFTTGSYCTFTTGSYCTFTTGSDCTFNTWDDCTFKTGANCVIVRKDIYEIIEIPEPTTIKLNAYGEKGYVGSGW